MWGIVKSKMHERTPLAYIELVLALAAIIGGLYLISPFIDPVSVTLNVSVPLVKLLGDTLALVIFSGLYLTSGIGMLLAAFFDNYLWRSRFIFLNLVLRSFSLIGTIAIQGLFPLTWLSSAVIMIILTILYFNDRILMRRDS